MGMNSKTIRGMGNAFVFGSLSAKKIYKGARKAKISDAKVFVRGKQIGPKEMKEKAPEVYNFIKRSGR